MRLITLSLAVLLLMIQGPLWFGKGGWLRSIELEAQVDLNHQKVALLKNRNAKLESEVVDLRDGTGSIEERARFELGMVKQNEIFVQIVQPGTAAVSQEAGPVEDAPSAPSANKSVNTSPASQR
jgi:cell division protein FtsB